MPAPTIATSTRRSPSSAGYSGISTVSHHNVSRRFASAISPPFRGKGFARGMPVRAGAERKSADVAQRPQLVEELLVGLRGLRGPPLLPLAPRADRPRRV